MAKGRLVLKKEYEGKVIIKTLDRMGEVEFDTSKVGIDEYENYERMGFGNCFDRVDEMKVIISEGDENEGDENEGDSAGLTEGDAKADLEGTKRPDNATEKAVKLLRDDYVKMKLPQLKEIAGKMDLKIDASWTKAQLIDEILK